MRRIVWSPDALHDLRRQFSYLLRIDAALAAATVATIGARADCLGEHALLTSPLHGRGRKALVPGTAYLIIFRCDDRQVEILRVRHTSENWLPR